MISNNILWIFANFQQVISHILNSEYLLFFQINGKLLAVSCRAGWRVKEKDRELSENLLCSKRLDMDDAVCKMAEIQNFFSSVTGVTRNRKENRAQGVKS